MPGSIHDSAYFLHQTPYRDNSALVHLLTQEHGKVSFIVSGLKAKKNAKRPFLQPCRRLAIGYQLKSGLSKLEHIDFADELQSPAITHFMLYQYANELLLTVLPAQLPVSLLFDDYRSFLQLLRDDKPHTALRYIELSLITAFAGLPDVTQTEDTKEKIDAKRHYYFYPERGIFAQQLHRQSDGTRIGGRQLQAFHYLATAYLQRDMAAISEPLSQGAKPLTSLLTTLLLNGKTLKTRLVYQALQGYNPHH